MFLISITNTTLCATGSFARVWNGWELNPEPFHCKFDTNYHYATITCRMVVFNSLS